jgi:hypothetical protein
MPAIRPASAVLEIMTNIVPVIVSAVLPAARPSGVSGIIGINCGKRRTFRASLALNQAFWLSRGAGSGKGLVAES